MLRRDLLKSVVGLLIAPFVGRSATTLPRPELPYLSHPYRIVPTSGSIFEGWPDSDSGYSLPTPQVSDKQRREVSEAIRKCFGEQRT